MSTTFTEQYNKNWTQAQLDAVFDYLKSIANPTDGRVKNFNWHDVANACGFGWRPNATRHIWQTFSILEEQGKIVVRTIPDTFGDVATYIVK